jgi:hypothetical protein
MGGGRVVEDKSRYIKKKTQIFGFFLENQPNQIFAQQARLVRGR